MEYNSESVRHLLSKYKCDDGSRLNQVANNLAINTNVSIEEAWITLIAGVIAWGRKRCVKCILNERVEVTPLNSPDRRYIESLPHEHY